MWNPNIPSEFNADINSAHPSGGVAPRQFDLARHVYLEKRRAHAELDRHDHCKLMVFFAKANGRL
jgi:hypothetical protein